VHGYLNIKAEQDPILEMIYGSNFIESAGLSRAETLEIGARVLNGEDYGDCILSQAHMEVTQHIEAFLYLKNALLAENNLTEEMILHTHRILCKSNKVR